MFTRPTEYPDAAAAQGTNYIVDVHVAFYELCVFQDIGWRRQDPLHSHEFGDAGVLLVRVWPLRDAANVAFLRQETKDLGFQHNLLIKWIISAALESCGKFCTRYCRGFKPKKVGIR